MRRSITLDRAQTKRLVYLASQRGCHMVPLTGKGYELRAGITLRFTEEGAIIECDDTALTELALRDLLDE